MIAYIYLMYDIMDKVLGGIVVFLALGLLLPELISSFTSFDWSNVTISGEAKDYSLVPKLFMLGLVITLIVGSIKVIPRLKK